MKAHVAVCVILIVGIVFLISSMPSANATLCQKVAVSYNYPRQAGEDQVVRVSSTVAGSCVSDGEDYFAVRVDLADNFTGAILASNSTPIGYDANNFSVTVWNAAVTPKSNESWPVVVNTYLIQAGATSGKYLLNGTTITIQVGDSTLPEFAFNPAYALAVALIPAAFLTYGKHPNRRARVSREKMK